MIPRVYIHMQKFNLMTQKFLEMLKFQKSWNMIDQDQLGHS